MLNDIAPHTATTQGPPLRAGHWHARLGPPLAALLVLNFTGIAMTIVGRQGFSSDALFYTTLALLTLSNLGFALLMYLRIRSNLLTPLTEMRSWAQEIRSGKLSKRLHTDQSGEYANLAGDINEVSGMLQTLAEDMQSQVKKQTKYIEQKTRSLEIIYDVAASINVSRDLEDLLTRFLHTLKEVVKARAAVVRLVTDDNQMRLVASTGLSDEVIQREQLLPAKTCLCGNAYSTGTVMFQRDVSECDQIIGHTFFKGEKIGMIAVPLQYRDRTLGVYNLFVAQQDFAEREREDIKDLLTSIGRHLGMAIDKARVDDETNRLSIMEERTRLAHELHDSLAQTLASLRFQVRVLDETLRTGQEQAVWHELEQIENNLDEAYAELRELITHFRAPIDRRGLVPAVQHLVDRFRKQTDSHIFLQKEWNLIHLPASIEVQVLRIIQEALNNIRKHSQAQNVRILMRSDPHGKCRILIEDDGVGMAEKRAKDGADHYGLHIMQERARQIDGELRIESEAGEGTQIILEFRHTGSGIAPSLPTLPKIEISAAFKRSLP